MTLTLEPVKWRAVADARLFLQGVAVLRPVHQVEVAHLVPTRRPAGTQPNQTKDSVNLWLTRSQTSGIAQAMNELLACHGEVSSYHTITLAGVQIVGISSFNLYDAMRIKSRIVYRLQLCCNIF